MEDLDYILLPILISTSIGCEIILVYAFTRVSEMRKYSGIYFIIKRIYLIVFDLHFITRLGFAKDNIECKIIGAISMSCFLLGCCCNLFVSLEVY